MNKLNVVEMTDAELIEAAKTLHITVKTNRRHGTNVKSSTQINGIKVAREMERRGLSSK